MSKKQKKKKKHKTRQQNKKNDQYPIGVEKRKKTNLWFVSFLPELSDQRERGRGRETSVHERFILATHTQLERGKEK